VIRPTDLNGSQEVVHSNSTNGALHQTYEGTCAVDPERTNTSPCVRMMPGPMDGAGEVNPQFNWSLDRFRPLTPNPEFLLPPLPNRLQEEAQEYESATEGGGAPGSVRRLHNLLGP
jgi:hypothetical protein